MQLAPALPSLAPPVARRGSARRPSRPPATLRVSLLGWLALGVAVLAVVPPARGGAALGATVPFWLVAAPLINLAWLQRKDLLRALRAWRRRQLPARQALRLPRRRMGPALRSGSHRRRVLPG